MVDLNNNNPDPDFFADTDITSSFTQDRKAVAILDNTIAVIQTADETITTIFIASEDTGLAVRLVLDSHTLCLAEISHVNLIAIPKDDDKPKPEDK
jgi:hypothetical protein